MKRFTSVLALALTVLIGANVAQAAKPAGKAANKAAKADKPGKGAGVQGIVSAVNGTNIVVQPRGKAAAEVTIATDGATKFEGGATALADIKPGMRVSASPAAGTASKVTVTAGGKADKGAKKPKKAK